MPILRNGLQVDQNYAQTALGIIKAPRCSTQPFITMIYDWKTKTKEYLYLFRIYDSYCWTYINLILDIETAYSYLLNIDMFHGGGNEKYPLHAHFEVSLP